MTTTAVLLAAGLGTRMKSTLPKALHGIAGRPMLNHLIESCAAVFDRIVVVTGPDMEVVAKAASPHATVVQHDRLGTAHAAQQAAPLFGDGDVAVLYADNPLIRPDTLRRLLSARQHSSLAMLVMRPRDPGRYGRVITKAGQDGHDPDGHDPNGHDQVERIVEWADATEAERAVPLCNAGVFCASAADLVRWLGTVQPSPKGEYYLTDCVAACAAEGGTVRAVEAAEAELRGINSRSELAEAEATVQSWLRRAAMDGGATLTAPDTVTLCVDTALAPDVIVGPHVVFGPGVSVASGAEIRPFSHLEGCQVGEGAIIGPYARLRPGTVVERAAHVGNFVELKATRLGAGAKANHLSYLGDSVIGPATNIGAGTITCNYDGYGKHRTTIGAGVFVGTHATLVAPVALGDGSFVAAGSVITQDVPADAMAFGRATQVEKPGRAKAYRTAKGAK
ncbi:MAG: bifunctional UDP-N-acetylglucosamine diphosphorylase/glucosamine-1-phosphate N-acetyltransferase GlmU [Janthinobacterium lividum]